MLHVVINDGLCPVNRMAHLAAAGGRRSLRKDVGDARSSGLA
jgi:hypothetical protein